MIDVNLPNVILEDADDGMLLDTLHVYVPETVTVRVWVYCAVIRSFNTVLVPSVMTVVESLDQDTVVAGPPVVIKVRVCLLNMMFEDFETLPPILLLQTNP